MNSGNTARQLDAMRRDWDRRARENACYYVATGRQDWSEEEFYRSGELHVRQHILNDLENICQGRDPKQMRVLEIGCGAGRITRALASMFGQVYAVDISREMVRRARRALREFPTVHIFQNNGRDFAVVRRGWWRRIRREPELRVDFVFSYIVFQHIPSREIIENYVREANRILRPGGLFKFQVQGSSAMEILAGDSWVGVPFTEREAREMAQRCGFEMRHHEGAGGQYYWLWLFKERELTG
jgi:SAM-dependent methyltransferase